MSIWASHTGGPVVPDRDEWTGEPTGEEVAYAFDVATSMADIFRFSVYPVVPNADYGWQAAGYDVAKPWPHVKVYLTADEGSALIALIQSGIDGVT